LYQQYQQRKPIREIEGDLLRMGYPIGDHTLYKHRKHQAILLERLARADHDPERARIERELLKLKVEQLRLARNREEALAAALDAHHDLAVERLDDIPTTTAQLIAAGEVIGWFQGRMEYGPRALGARSVLADPRDPAMRDRINAKLKQRDWFMPFAPSVLAEYCEDVFVNYRPSPYMNLAFAVKPPYDEQVPAVMHVDRTARPQAVSAADNPLYHATIEAFRQRTGVPLVLNTSFNRHGLPIVCTPEDAVNHLRWGCIDALVIGPFLARRAGPVVPYPGRRAIVDLD
ncbi:MAG: hypothetical protein NZ518_09855, partial [Dehalococcoidia bacterium]|nr:hypothetical protein [Dehalococcoidia bacterium]